jgi:hypothetical protein
LARRQGGKTPGMTNEPEQQQEPIDDDELEEQEGEELPDREVMSIIDPTTGDLGFIPVDGTATDTDPWQPA